MSEKCKCGQPHDDWPGKDGGMLCQMCWEAECSESWWDAVIGIDKAQHEQQLATMQAGVKGESNGE